MKKSKLLLSMLWKLKAGPDAMDRADWTAGGVSFAKPTPKRGRR
jgi:hypothetical protein